MAKVTIDGSVLGSVEEVWAVVGDFGGIADWVPPLASSSLAPGATGKRIGDLREIVLDGGPTFMETQTARSDDDYTYSYTIPEGVLPIKNYEGTIKLRAEGDRTVVEWSSIFDPDPGAEEEVSGMVKGVYEAGIGDLQQRFGG